MSLSVSQAAFVAANANVVAIVDGPTTSKLFSVVNSWAGGSTTAPPTSATTSVAPGLTAYPTVASVALVAAGDGVNNEQVGQVKLTLAPAAGDVVDASSPMTYTVSPNALVIVASTPTG